jgi:hypothetical protein
LKKKKKEAVGAVGDRWSVGYRDTYTMAQKRASDSDDTQGAKLAKTETRPSSNIVGISRTIAACQRCRQKKTKCDQQFPSCARCLKANIPCVGLDPATGRQIPRSYVISLEDRILQLEKIIKDSGLSADGSPAASFKNELNENYTPSSDTSISPPKTELKEKLTIKSTLEFSNPNGVSFYLGDSSGISFAKLLFTAVNFSPGSISENNSITTRVPNQRSSPASSAAPLPDKSAAEFLIKSYFEQSNTQLPILHREHFINNHFRPIYGLLSSDVKLASNYTKMNLDNEPTEGSFYNEMETSHLTAENVPKIHHKSIFLLNMIFSIASSINYLTYKDPEISNSYKNQAMVFVDSIYQSEDRLEYLQGLLLLTLFSIMRPSTPGCWYILGTTLRLCVDLGLHTEKLNHQFDPFTKDMRRRLFWCAYSLDRQICIYLGRPFGIPEESVTTKFPIDMDDCLINVDEVYDYSLAANSLPSYKTISINFFKIRKIQSEILHVLYFPNSQLPRQDENLIQWKERIHNQLESWFKSIPSKTSRKSNSDFNFEFFKLNYYHSKLLLFGVTPKNSKITPKTLKILFNASRGIIRCYFELFKAKTINYTWAAVHNLFMAGISFFYSIYKSDEKLMELKEFEHDIKLVLQVLNSLVESCDAASSCVEIFEILSLVIIKLKFEMAEIYEDSASNVDEIERFFEKLNKEQEDERKQNALSNPLISNGNSTATLTSMTTTPINHNIEKVKRRSNSAHEAEEMNYPSLSTPPFIAPSNEEDFEQLKIFELMNQVSTDTIWDQFFAASGDDFH